LEVADDATELARPL